jgi:hypothetical protein
VKTSITLSIIFAVLAFSGCTCKPEIVIQEKVVKVPVMQKCPQPVCGDDLEAYDKMNNVQLLQEVVSCSIRRKEALEVCR